MNVQIVAVLNDRGNVGKTTIATNLARGLQLEGLEVLLIDSDPKGSSRDWYAAAAEDNPLPAVTGLDRPALFRQIYSVCRGFDCVVLDGAPSDKAIAEAVIRTADAILIPIQPSPYDARAVESLVNLVRSRQQLTEGRPRAAFVISQQIIGAQVSNEVGNILRSYGFGIFLSFTSQRAAYPHSSACGSTVLDDEPDGPAAVEIRSIVQEVMRWL